MTDQAPSIPDTAAERSWVWHATFKSRVAGKISVLACAETLFAIALYWGIAIHWDTHWHLLSSVFIAPLLLLRSPESMKLGVRWFLKEGLGISNYEDWSKAKREKWLIRAAVLTGIAVYPLASWLSGLWLVGQSGWLLLGWSMLIGGLSLAFTVTIVIMITGTVVGSGTAMTLSKVAGGGVVAGGAMGAGVSVGMFAGVVAGAGGFVGAFVGAGAGATAYVGLGMGLGLAARGLVFRVVATLRYLPQGLGRLPENWQENNFWVDFFVPAELIPGIREEDESFAFDGFIRSLSETENKVFKWGAGPPLAAFFFLPAFLYRLNIKATCWFWWPLVFLLKPQPKADKTGEQKQALCWPWDNPLQRLLILVPALIVLVILIAEYCDFGLWQQFKNAAAVPIPLKLALGMEWSHITPWHWALLIVEITGLGMLMIAGNACSHKANDNWDTYACSCMQTQLWLMNALMRVRSLAAKAFMLLGLGMCLISFPEWRQKLPAPLLQQLETFYHARDSDARGTADPLRL
ncbi:hypothetical protein [Prosthecobacter sp.]|uniref:hypothetical protein n=1 Tax=Prosthecobacter sp. TaxID=1965333 RepID=UPI002487FA59|nr:hypothetical protein [Prosthecobacter sp.]MDI1312109.1 hypothetical protein [Prosthecobacter sp.]